METKKTKKKISEPTIEIHNTVVSAEDVINARNDLDVKVPPNNGKIVTALKNSNLPDIKIRTDNNDIQI